MRTQVSFILIGVMSLGLVACDRVSIRPSPTTVQELAEEVGVSISSAEVSSFLPHYARLVATTTDSHGREERDEIALPIAERSFRAQVVLNRDVVAGGYRNFSYILSSRSGSQRHYLHLEPGAKQMQSTRKISGGFFYEVNLEGKEGKMKTSIVLETSRNPFPSAKQPDPNLPPTP